MRISTNQVYQTGLSSLLTQQMRVTKLQEMLATGVKVQYASDDPISYAQIQWLNQRVSTTELLQTNCVNAQNALGLEESLLTNSVSSLQRLRDIQVLVGNGTLSDIQRKAYSVEVSDILTQLQAFGNTKDNNGNYLFAGGQTSTEPFSLNAAGEYVYNGDSTTRYQVISGSLQIAINDPGNGIFMNIPGGNGSFTVSQTATANTGTASTSTGSVTNEAAYIPDNYTINFVSNSAGQLVVMVSGAASGNVIPPSGSPDDAPLYQEGMSVSFNGMTVDVSGMPNPGDAFAINPATNTSIFATIQSMVNNLSLPYSTASEKAAAVTVNNQILAQIDSALSNFTNMLASIGSRMNQVSSSSDSNQDLIDMSKEILKTLTDIDPVNVATEFNQELVNLQAAQESFVRLQNLSLFNYI